MMRFVIAFPVCLTLMSVTVSAQGTTGSTSRQTTGTSGVSGTSAASSAANAAGATAGGQGNVGRPSGNNSGLQGSSGVADGPQFNAGDGSLGAQVGQNGFVGGNNNNGMVGNRNVGQGNAGAQQSNFNAMGAGRGSNNAQSQAPKMTIRPQFRIAFSPPQVSSSVLQERVSSQLVSIPQLPASNVNVDVDSAGMATLSGQAKSEDDRKLLEAFVRLEPGIRGVTNKILVAPTAP